VPGWCTLVERSQCLGVTLALLLLGTGCYSFRPSSGGGSSEFQPPRTVRVADVAVPPGYRIELVVEGLNFPTGVTFDSEGNPVVVESGYSYGEVWTTPRLLRIRAGQRPEVLTQGRNNGPWTGATFHDGAFYVAEGGTREGGRILRVGQDGAVKALVENLPSKGDHHTDGPVVGPDGWVYFGQGTFTNSGVVGEDNADFGWLKRFPELHDIPGQDVVLAGQDFITKDPLRPGSKVLVSTGAFSPFGKPTEVAQVVRGQVPCNGAILRVRPEGGPVELVAWGLRNPFGLAFAPDGNLYVTENSYDDRGSRPVWGSPDVLWRIQHGLWYGWPDFAAGQPLTNAAFRPPGKAQPHFLLAMHPNPPPKPAARFAVHASADGLDFSRNAGFGHVGEAFVAMLGDETPATGKLLHPVGFKVVRVNVETGEVQDFVVNKGYSNGPASKLGTGGLERPVAARFDPSGRHL
jgi:glucose/arabinose dehydrogenase